MQNLQKYIDTQTEPEFDINLLVIREKCTNITSEGNEFVLKTSGFFNTLKNLEYSDVLLKNFFAPISKDGYDIYIQMGRGIRLSGNIRFCFKFIKSEMEFLNGERFLKIT